MTCQEVMDYMQRHLDGDLSEYETVILTEHISHCPECATMYERLKLLSSELENLPKVMPQYCLVDAILPQLERIELFGAARRAAEPSASAPLMPVVLPEDPDPRRTGKPRTRHWTERLSVRAFSGVAAAGLVIGLFLVTYNPNTANKVLDSGAALESADSSLRSGAAGDSAASEEKGQITELQLSLKSEFNSSSSAGNDAAADSANAAEPAQESPNPQPSVNGAVPTDNDGQAPKRRSDQDQTAPAAPPKQDQEKNAAPNVPVTPNHDGSASFSADAADGASNGQSAETGNFADSAAGATDAPADNKLFAVQDQSGEQAGSASESNKMGIMQAPAGELSVSPNGAYTAYVADSRVTVYDAVTGAILFQSREKTSKPTLGAWTEDSRFIEYEVRQSAGTVERFKVNAQEGTESKI